MCIFVCLVLLLLVLACFLFVLGGFGVILFCGGYGRGVLMIHLSYFYVIILVSHVWLQVKMASGSLTKVIIRITKLGGHGHMNNIT